MIERFWQLSSVDKWTYTYMKQGFGWEKEKEAEEGRLVKQDENSLKQKRAFFPQEITFSQI